MKITIETDSTVTITAGRDSPFVPHYLRHAVTSIDNDRGFMCSYCGSQPARLIDAPCPLREQVVREYEQKTRRSG